MQLYSYSMDGITLFSLLILVLSQCLLVAPNPRGAPTKVCESLTAEMGHGDPNKEIPAPYKITVKLQSGKYKGEWKKKMKKKYHHHQVQTGC